MSVIGSNALAGASGQGGGGYLIEKSLRFNSGDSAYLSRTPSSSGNRQQWTFSAWIKFTKSVGNLGIFEVPYITGGADSTITSCFEVWYSGGYIRISDQSTYYFTASTPLRDPSAWGHLVIRVDTTLATAADRIRLYWNGERLANTASGVVAQNAELAVNKSAAHQIGNWRGSTYSNLYYAEIHHVDGQSLDPTEFAAYDDNNVWRPIEYTGSHGTNGFHLDFADGTDIGNDAAGSNNWTANNLTDYSNSPNGSGSVTAGAPFNATYPWTTAFDGSITSVGAVGNTSGANDYVWTFGTTLSGTTAAFVVYSTYVTAFDNGNHASINGTALTSSNWTKTTNTLPVAEGNSGDYSVYTFSLGGSNLSSVGVGSNVRIAAVLLDGVPLIFDSAGDNDVLRDSPTNGDATADTGAGGEVSGNYCTLNPLHELTGGYDLALSNGNLEVTNGGDAPGTMAFGSGKKYFELTVKSASGFSQGYYGIVNIADHIRPRAWSTSQIAALRDSGSLYGDGSTGSAPAATQVGDVYGFAVDVDNQKLFISVNGTYLNNADPASGTGASFTGRDFSNYAPLASLATTNSQTIVLNAGQRTFNTAAPSGYKALCTANLPTPDVPDGSDYFDAKLYDGNGSTNAITGLEFSPDLVWLKSRTAARSHCLFDTVRGVNKRILSNTNDEQYTVANTLTSFDNNGFTLGSNNEANNSGESLVAWAWDAGTSNTTVSAGSLNSSLYDQSQTWSTYGTFDNNWSNSAYHWDDVFNTTLTNNGAGALYVDGTTKDTWNLSSSYAVSNTIKVYTQNPTEITINEGLSSEKVVTSDGGNTLHYFEFSFTGNVESVGVRHSSGGGIYLMGIWFDGKQLVDDTETPANLPSLASTYRANPSSGFSIVNYTSNAGNLETIAHGLGIAPEFVLCKRLDTAGDWWAGHVGAGWNQGGYLQVSDAFATAPNWWQDTAPTSQLVTLGSYPLTGSSGNYIAYCFAPVAGYSAFGKYIGNGSSDGPFVYTGFRPAFVMYKRTDSTSNWYVDDSKRLGYNFANKNLYPDDPGQESSGSFTDFLSNGFKLRAAGVRNTNAASYLFAAFAENPFQANGGLAR